MTVEEIGEGVEGSDAVFAGGGEVAADVREAVRAIEFAEAGGDLAVQLHGAEVAFGLVVCHGHVEVAHVAEDVASVVAERDSEVVGAPFEVVAFAAAGRFGVGGETVGDEGVVVFREAALECWCEGAMPDESRSFARGVDLDEQFSERGRPARLGVHLGDVGEIAEQVGPAYAVFGSFQPQPFRSVRAGGADEF